MISLVAKDYSLASEEFIWKDLQVRGELALRLVRDLWNKDHAVPRMVIAWPGEEVKANDGKPVDLVTLAVPPEVTTHKALRDMLERTHAYALLLVEQTKDAVELTLESAHGAYHWSLPIRRHGDVPVLEMARATKNTQSLGLLWRRQSAMN
jgi:hypothetical protein